MKHLTVKMIFVICGLSVAAGGWIGCQQRPGEQKDRATIDSLQMLVNNLKPGLGEFMIQMKYHHDRLGEAIAAKDYERAAYEIGEMQETGEKIVQLGISNERLQQPFVVFYEKYLKSPLSVLADAAAKKDGASLGTNFAALTGNCNSCHHENQMPFMKID